MSIVGRLASFAGSLTTPTAAQEYAIGQKIEVDGVEYTYTQADDTITANQALKLDAAASASAKKVTPTAAATDIIVGVALQAVTDEYYFWMATQGLVTVNVADGTAVGDNLGASGTAGVAAKTAEAGSGMYDVPRLVALEANSSGGAAAKKAYLA